MLTISSVSRIRGFSLIEMMIAVVIIGILLALSLPSYRDWIQNTQIRTSSESLINAIQLARTEAARRNISARFQLMTGLDGGCAASTDGKFWVVSVYDATGLCDKTPDTDTMPGTVAPGTNPLIVQTSSNEIGATATITASQAALVFTSLGRLTPLPADFVTIDITNTTSGGTCIKDGGKMRCLRIEVAPGGQIRMCDRSISTAGDPRKCESA